VGPRLTLAMHGNANKISKRGNRKGFIAPCWRVYRISDRYQRFEARRVIVARGPRIRRDLRWRKLNFPRRFYLVWIVLADGHAASLFGFTTIAAEQDVVPYASRPALQRPAIRCSTISGCHQIANSSRGSLAMSGLCIKRVWRASFAAAI
jgi:hypothetical protein